MSQLFEFLIVLFVLTNLSLEFLLKRADESDDLSVICVYLPLLIFDVLYLNLCYPEFILEMLQHQGLVSFTELDQVLALVLLNVFQSLDFSLQL